MCKSFDRKKKQVMLTLILIKVKYLQIVFSFEKSLMFKNTPPRFPQPIKQSPPPAKFLIPPLTLTATLFEKS